MCIKKEHILPFECGGTDEGFHQYAHSQNCSKTKGAWEKTRLPSLHSSSSLFFIIYLLDKKI
jgi:hypothetical protein